jgi:hypothetical protein
MKRILMLLFILITACTTILPDSNEHSIIDNNTEIQEELSEDEISFKELENTFKIVTNPDHDAIGIKRADELKSQVDYFADKGFEVQHLQDSLHIIDAKNIEFILPKEDTVAPEPIQICTSNPDPVFTHEFTDTTKIVEISPSGFWITPEIFKGHSFIWTEGNNVPLYAPVDMTLRSGVFNIENNQSQYILYFEVSCEVTIRFGHVHEPINAIKEVFPDVPREDTRGYAVERIDFKAGDLIAHTRGNDPSGNWDFGVYNTDKPNNLPGVESSSKIANCPYDYYENSNIYKELYEVESLLCKK